MEGLIPPGGETLREGHSKPARRTAKHLRLMDRLPRGGSWAFFGARSLRDDAKTPAKRVALAG